MFRLLRILHTGANVPEPVKLEKSTVKINVGTALILKTGKMQIPTSTEKPTHIALENVSADDAAVICYEIIPEMIFETTVSADPSSLKLGDKLTLGFDSDSCAAKVTATTASGVATVYDLRGTVTAGDKITVKF